MTEFGVSKKEKEDIHAGLTMFAGVDSLVGRLEEMSLDMKNPRS